MYNDNDQMTPNSNLSKERESLLRDRLRGKVKTQAIPKRPNQARASLSFGQERLWFLHQLEPQSPVYNRPLGLRFRGEIDIKAIERSVNKIVTRHESLRSSIRTEHGVPILQIAEELNIRIPIRDLSKFPINMRMCEAQQCAAEESKIPFDLSQGPLLRGLLICLDTEDHVLILVFHHMIFDWWSANVLRSEFCALYSTQITGENCLLPDLEIQYYDFTHWQLIEYSDDNLDRGLSFWCDQLGKDPHSLQLPIDHQRPPVQTYSGASKSLQLSKNLTKELLRVSREEDSTLFMILYAAFNVLLLRYTGHHDITVGVPTAGRTHKETEHLIGLFINILVLRTDLTGDPTVRELIQHIRKLVLEGFAHQTIPFEKLVEKLNPERDLSRSPLFQVLFNLKNFPDVDSKAGSLVIEPFHFDPGIAQYDLNMELQVIDERLCCNLVFNTDLFDPDMAIRFLDHFNNLLDQFVTAPDERISTLDILSDIEHSQLLTSWNGLETEDRGLGCIHQYFEQHAEKNPEAIAVIDKDSQFTYRQLNEYANQIAHTLIQKDLQPEMFVGIYLERSVRTIASLLAVMKTGGAYIPLNPTHPSKRLALILENTRMHTIITEENAIDNLPPHNVDLLDLIADNDKIRMQSIENLGIVVAANQLIYMLHTSGSTGKPKGILVEHQNVVNALISFTLEPGLVKDDILLSVTADDFDISALEFFLPLIVGARIIMVDRKTTRDGFLLKEALAQSRATVMQATPATWHLLLSAGWRGDNNLKILCGGESLDRSLANNLLDRGACLWNLYGPTETTIYSVIHKVKYGKDRIPIGKPIANTQIYIVDPNFELVPIGISGEIIIGGSGVSRGYHKLPALTAERFVSNHFRREEDTHLYKTGDLGRRRADGTIEFLGRQDQQVKIHGYRIELEDIEFHLQRYPGVQAAVLTTPEFHRKDLQLLAFIVMRDAKTIPVESIRKFLGKELPQYMIPSIYIQLDSLPLTSSGKIDRNALPAIDKNQLSVEESHDKPRNNIERKLSAIWVDILNLKSAGIHDNFFDLGGHSLLATQVAARIRDEFHLEIVVRHLFESGQTIAGLAQIIDSLQWLSKQSRDLNNSDEVGHEEGEL